MCPFTAQDPQGNLAQGSQGDGQQQPNINTNNAAAPVSDSAGTNNDNKQGEVMVDSVHQPAQAVISDSIQAGNEAQHADNVVVQAESNNVQQNNEHVVAQDSQHVVNVHGGGRRSENADLTQGEGQIVQEVEHVGQGQANLQSQEV